MSEQRRRRTERLFLRYRIQVKGRDTSGTAFAVTTHTVVVNRHGGRIVLKHEVSPGEVIRITQVARDLTADFRVVGLAGRTADGDGEWGVECRDENTNFWGINFPPLDETADSSNALLECSQCHEVALTAFSMVDYDLLESAGGLVRNCKSCGAETRWIYARVPTGMPSPAEEMAPEAADGAPDETLTAVSPGVSVAPLVERRASPRIPLRWPVRVRGSEDVTDLTKSENVSKGGLAFTSDKLFEVDEILYVTCPYDPGGSNIEVKGRVARRESIAGTERYLYGVEYQQ